jgi:hypothetical protein
MIVTRCHFLYVVLQGYQSVLYVQLAMNPSAWLEAAAMVDLLERLRGIIYPKESTKLEARASTSHGKRELKMRAPQTAPYVWVRL